MLERLHSHSPYLVAILFFVYISTACCLKFVPGCMELSQYGFALEDHYDSFHAETLATCLMTCSNDEIGGCKSLSYDVASKLCQLSKETQATKPMLFKAKGNSVYITVPENVGAQAKMTDFPTTHPQTTTTSPSELTTESQTTTTSPPELTTESQTTTGSPPEVATESQTTTISPPEITTQPETTTELSTTEQLPTTLPPTTAAQSFDQSTFCVDKLAGDYPYPGDCTQYVTCASPTMVYVRPCGVSFFPGLCNDC